MQPQLEEATRSRFDREGDWEALQLFSEADRSMSPEEYAARRSHLWDCFALHFYRYRDPILGTWVRRVGELFDNPQEVQKLRERLLTNKELAEIERQMAED
jgi:hypothetical protein